MIHTVLETDEFQCGHHVFATLLGIELGEQQGEFHVFEGGEHGDQIESLENVSDMLIAPVGRLGVAEAEDILAQHEQIT